MRQYVRVADEFPRPMTTREREVLGALLSVDFPGVEGLREQARTASVVDKCKCGCPTIHFAVGLENGRNHLVVEAAAPEEQFQDVLLFVTDSGLDSMESSWTTDVPPAELPAAADLTVTAR